MSVATELPNLIESAIATAQSEINNNKDLEAQLHIVQDTWANANNVLEVIPINDYKAKPNSKNTSNEDMLKKIHEIQNKNEESAKKSRKESDSDDEDSSLVLDSDSDSEEEEQPKKKKSPKKNSKDKKKKKPAKSDSDSDSEDEVMGEDEDDEPKKKKNKRSVSPKKRPSKDEDEAMGEEEEEEEEETCVAKVTVPKKASVIDLSEEEEEDAKGKRGKKRSRESDSEEEDSVEDEEEEAPKVSAKRAKIDSKEWVYYYIDRNELEFLLEHPSHLIKRDKHFTSQGRGKIDYKFACALYTDKAKTILRRFMPCGNCKNCARCQRFCTNNSNSTKLHEVNRTFYAIDKGTDKIQIMCHHCYSNNIPCMIEKSHNTRALPKDLVKIIKKNHEKYLEERKSASAKKQPIVLTETHKSLVEKAVQPFDVWAKAFSKMSDLDLGMASFVSYRYKDAEYTQSILDVLAQVLVPFKEAYSKQEHHFKVFKMNVANKVDVISNLRFWRTQCSDERARATAEKEIEDWANTRNGLYEEGAFSIKSARTASDELPKENFFKWQGDMVKSLKESFDKAMTATDHESNEPKSLLLVFKRILNLLSWLGRVIVHAYRYHAKSITVANLVAFKNKILCLL